MIVLAFAARPGVELAAIDPHGGNDRGPQEIDADGSVATPTTPYFESNLSRPVSVTAFAACGCSYARRWPRLPTKSTFRASTVPIATTRSAATSSRGARAWRPAGRC